MATIEELIAANQVPERFPDTPTTPAAAAQPTEGLLGRIQNFVAGSADPKTLDAGGLTQADRRQALFAGLTDIGAKLMAAGEPMWGHQRAQYLAGLGSVPADMQRMRTGIAQQRLLGVKSAEAVRAMQVQNEMDAVAKDPNHPMWSQFQGQDRFLAQWAMRSGGPKAFMEFLAHKDDAKYKAALAAKAAAEVAEMQRVAGVQEQIIRAMGGGTQPAPTQPAPTQPAPTAPAQPSPPSAATGATLPPFQIPGVPTAALTPEQQILVAQAPPTAGVGGAEAAAASELRQGGGESPTEPPASIMRLPKPGTPTPTPVQTQPPPVQTQPPPVQTQPPPTGPNSVPRAPRTLAEVGQIIPPAQLLPILGLKGNEFFKALETLVAPGMTPVYDSQTGDLVNVPSNQLYSLDPRRFKPAAAAQQAYQEKKFEYDKKQDAARLQLEKIQRDIAAAKDGYKIEDGKLVQDPDAIRHLEQLKIQEENIRAAANMIPEQRATQKRDTDIREAAERRQAAAAGQSYGTGEFDPNKQAAIQEDKAQEARNKADIELRKEFATQDFKQYTDPDKGPLAVAKGANKMLPLIYEAEEYLKRGMLTGSFSEGRMFYNRMADLLGVGKVDQAQVDRVGYNNVVGRMMIEGLSAGRPLGSQVSDADREAMKELTGLGNYTDKEIAKLMAIAERTAMKAFKNHQISVSELSRKHPSLKDILAVDAEIKPLDRDTWRQEFTADEQRRKQEADELSKFR